MKAFVTILFLYCSTLPVEANSQQQEDLPLKKTPASIALRYAHQQETYGAAIQRIKNDRSDMFKNKCSIDSCRTYFLEQFEYVVFPKWIGTKWDFNGHTNTPGQDQLIACGYFVSTTLKHMGFNWNRYELAKMYSSNIVDHTCENIRQFSDLTTLETYLNKQKNNLFIVGLDSHVGFLLKNNEGLWFVHSNYYGNIGPQMEALFSSDALNDSNRYYVGTLLTANGLNKWLNNTFYSF